MKTLLEIISYGFLSLLLTISFIPFIRKVAISVNLVDKPNYRKVHLDTVPLIGGIAIALVVFMVIFISGFRNVFIKEYFSVFAGAITLLIVGIIDDKNDISAKYKLAIQLILALIIALSGTRLTSLYGLFGIYEISTWIQYLLTILIITGVVNAFNLMDGVDGLMGGLSLIGFSIFLISAIYFKDYFLVFLSAVFMGAIVGFLKFNLGKKKIFIGDSGSLFIGFIMITLAIKFLQKNMLPHDTTPDLVLLILLVFFSIPVFDSLRVYMGRMKNGKSPFKADKSHLHHLLLSIGLTHKKVDIVISAICMLMLILIVSLKSFLTMTLIIMLLILSFSIIIRLLLMINKLYQWTTRIKVMECSVNKKESNLDY
ncbi:glycosyltransferase family 4 protein [Flavobacterium suzhouense]|uniref:Glycosyltransferase family 4 protein n=1 Tax=Flavobacterium suzhouense TaxID=1529638 RepID=A0ABW5NVL0_9FLAO